MQIIGRDPNKQPNFLAKTQHWVWHLRIDPIQWDRPTWSSQLVKAPNEVREICLLDINICISSHKGGDNVHKKIFCTRFTALVRHAPLLPWTALFARPQEWAAAPRYWFGAPFFHCCPFPALAEPSAHLQKDKYSVFAHFVYENMINFARVNLYLFNKVLLPLYQCCGSGSDRHHFGGSGSVSISTKCKAKLYFFQKISKKLSKIENIMTPMMLARKIKQCKLALDRHQNDGDLHDCFIGR